MINIGIVDDHAVVRMALKQFFTEHVDLRVVAEASNGREAIEMVRKTALDVLVLDLAMPGQNGLDAMAQIRAKMPSLGILIFSGLPENQYAMTLLRLGASGFLSKDCEPSTIVDALRLIAKGGRYITPPIADLLARGLSQGDSRCPPHEHLSDREFQVFIRLAKGETTSDVARVVSLSVKTVSTYRTRLKEKMSLSTNSDLTYYALTSHLID